MLGLAGKTAVLVKRTRKSEVIRIILTPQLVEDRNQHHVRKRCSESTLVYHSAAFFVGGSLGDASSDSETGELCLTLLRCVAVLHSPGISPLGAWGQSTDLIVSFFHRLVWRSVNGKLYRS